MAALGKWRQQARETAPFQCSPVEVSLVLLLQFFGERQEESGLLTVFPHIRPAGIIFLQGLQLRGLLECGYYSRAGIIF